MICKYSSPETLCRQHLHTKNIYRKDEYEEEPYRRSRRKADFLKTDELSLNLSHYIASLWKKIREFFVDLGL